MSMIDLAIHQQPSSHPSRLPPPNPKLPCPFLLPLVVLLPLSSSMSMISSIAVPPPRLLAGLSSPAATMASIALSLFLLTFSRSTASFFTRSTCDAKSANAASHRCDHDCSADCSAGSEPGARSRSGATDVTDMSECAGSSVAVMRPV
jgi:hypothetical protein